MAGTFLLRVELQLVKQPAMNTNQSVARVHRRWFQPTARSNIKFLKAFE